MTSKIRPQIEKSNPLAQTIAEGQQNADKFNRNQPTATKVNPYRANYKAKTVAQLRHKDPNYHYCLVGEKYVDEYQDVYGYEFDHHYHKDAYDETTGEPLGLTPKSGIPDKSGGKLYVMRIPKEWHEENEKLKASLVDEREKITKRGGAVNNKESATEGKVSMIDATDEIINL